MKIAPIKNQPYFNSLLTCLILLTGCVTPKIPDYHPTATSSTDRVVQQSGVEIAVDPFVESERTKQYFDLDAVADGIAILQVRVNNQTTNQTFFVRKKDFQLCSDKDAKGMTDDGHL